MVCYFQGNSWFVIFKVIVGLLNQFNSLNLVAPKGGKGPTAAGEDILEGGVEMCKQQHFCKQKRIFSHNRFFQKHLHTMNEWIGSFKEIKKRWLFEQTKKWTI